MAADRPWTGHLHPVAHMLGGRRAEVRAPPLLLRRDRVVPTCRTGKPGEPGGRVHCHGPRCDSALPRKASRSERGAKVRGDKHVVPDVSGGHSGFTEGTKDTLHPGVHPGPREGRGRWPHSDFRP
uniref:Uncharacterized protein n=1 Tax=Rousettus aegyptiacus TaxID=9407 RepID=A0A7J8BAD0_ROUAE|nr:hypothetical protein HJG63_009962 [Rousettus aegyptiacus]